MRRSFAALVARSGRHSHVQPQPGPPRDLRGVRDEHISQAREAIFGPQGVMPGDRYLRKGLEGRKLMRWYFPSKFNFQDFRVDEYFEMQAERFAPRPPHRCIAGLNTTAQEVAKHREELRSFFRNLDEQTFLNTPTLQDLYGMFRMVDPDPALSFPVPESIFVEHSPLWGASPPFSYPAQMLDVVETPSSTEQLEESDQSPPQSAGEDMPEELFALWAMVVEKMKEQSNATANALDARINQAQSEEQVRTLLFEEAQQLGIVAPFEDSTVVVEDGRMAAYLVRAKSGGSEDAKADSRKKAEEELNEMRTQGPEPVRRYLARRHRFVDPMFRRRRLKWLERQMGGKNKDKEVKFNSYYATHPDDHKEWPTNKGSVTVKWPSPYH